MDSVLSALTGLATTGSNVHRLRVYPQEATKLPSLNIVQGADTPIDLEDGQRVFDYVDRRLDIRVEIRAQATTAQIDQTLNQIAKEISIAMQAMGAIGVSAVIDVIEGIMNEPEISSDADVKTARMDMEWSIVYRHSRADPSQ